MTVPVESSRILNRIARFIRLVVSRFLANKGFLLASAVSYNTLLSLVPLLALLLVGMSHVYHEERLLEVLATQFDWVAPGQSAFVAAQIDNFLERRGLIGWIGVVVLLFFSSFVFRCIEDAFAVIFPRPGRRRSIWVSAVIPYAFMCVMAAGLLMLATFAIILDGISASMVVAGSFTTQLADTGIFLLGFLGVVVLFACMYRFIPVADVPLRRALVGGFAAACLWELVRHALVWYFANVSLVDVVYGSLATVIVILLTLEAGAVIFLLGAQVIAELERGSEQYEHASLVDSPG
ncbi:MAG: YhjD/YihY/BrkB family envelope integrity protein [Gammaproteobacteria bacterium]|nr:YhjD/YihY/BrkB family envelope integrity protein [Gammaproteobacteria bacterium]